MTRMSVSRFPICDKMAWQTAREAAEQAETRTCRERGDAFS
jgi:hypothetical protein